MSTIRTPRPLALAGLVAAFAVLVVLAFAGGRDAAAHGGDDRGADRITRAELDFRNDMRRLWEEHVTWTRLAVISLTTDAPDTEATVGRLLENQQDIGDALRPFYGKRAARELTGLLREHILIAADLIAAARAGDQDAVAAAQARWSANADEIAAFLAEANPRFWRLADLREMLGSHLSLTTTEVVARLQQDWEADVAAYDRIHLQALEMADVLSVGIIKQFPRRFR
jgi:hypothetical protein